MSGRANSIIPNSIIIVGGGASGVVLAAHLLKSTNPDLRVTLIESGVPDFIADSWIGVMAPAGTPADVIDKLNAAINAGLKSPEIRARFKALASEARPGTPQDFAAFIAAEVPKWTAMAKLSNLKPE